MTNHFLSHLTGDAGFHFCPLAIPRFIPRMIGAKSDPTLVIFGGADLTALGRGGQRYALLAVILDPLVLIMVLVGEQQTVPGVGEEPLVPLRGPAALSDQ